MTLFDYFKSIFLIVVTIAFIAIVAWIVVSITLHYVKYFSAIKSRNK